MTKRAMRSHDADMSFMYDMYTRVARRDTSIDRSECRTYLQMLANPALRESFYNPFVNGVRYTFAGNWARVTPRAAIRRDSTDDTALP